MNILPNRFLGVVGEHKDFPIENLSLSHCRQFLASCSHDQTIKFWDVTQVEKEEVDTKRKAKRGNISKVLNNASGARDDFFADLAKEEAEASASSTKVQDKDGSDSDMDSDPEEGVEDGNTGESDINSDSDDDDEGVEKD